MRRKQYLYFIDPLALIPWNCPVSRDGNPSNCNNVNLCSVVGQPQIEPPFLVFNIDGVCNRSCLCPWQSIGRREQFQNETGKLVLCRCEVCEWIIVVHPLFVLHNRWRVVFVVQRIVGEADHFRRSCASHAVNNTVVPCKAS